jgi:hypothetical protein
MNNEQDDQELNALEDRVLSLEFEKMKRMVASSLRPKPKPKAPSKQASAPSWTLSGHRVGDKTTYSTRTAAGIVTVLPDDRRAWPPDVRAVVERLEAVDKSRVRHGCMVSVCDEPARLVSGD